jgi:hypothetical protein
MRYRVRRQDLIDSSSDDGLGEDDQSRAELQARLNAQLASLLQFDYAAPQATASVPSTAAHTGQWEGESQMDDANADQQQQQQQQQEENEEAQEAAFTFRLFRNEAPSHTVVLEPQFDGSENAGPGAFVVAKRPMSYYVTGWPSEEAATTFRAAAVTAEYLLEADRCGGAQRRAAGHRHGSELPGRWKRRREAEAAGQEAQDRAAYEGQGEERKGGKRQEEARGERAAPPRQEEETKQAEAAQAKSEGEGEEAGAQGG